MKYLFVQKCRAEVLQIQDIVEVCEDYTPVHGCTVVGVLSLDSYLACLVCKSKLLSHMRNLGNVRSVLLYRKLGTARSCC